MGSAADRPGRISIKRSLKTLLHFAIVVLLFCCPHLVEAQKKGDAWSTPRWAANATLYEANIRQYTPEGTFRAFEKHLPRLRSMGINALWLMPIYPIGDKDRKGKLGNYYAVKDHRAVNPELGTMEDFKHLIRVAHSNGFKVILDWVSHCSSTDNALIKLHPEWYKHDSLGKLLPPAPDQCDAAAFDCNNKDLRQYLTETMSFWLDDADVDGFACDQAVLLPLEFWKQCRKELDKTKKVFLLAEAEGPEFHRNGFDMTYSFEYMRICNDIAKGNRMVSELYQYFYNWDEKYWDDDNVMYFTSCHSENSNNGSEFERLGKATQAFAVLSAMAPGMPMVFNGQESAFDHRISAFDKDTIAWDHFPLLGFYSKLLHLKEESRALLTDMHDDYDFDFLLNKDLPNSFCFVRRRDENQVLTVVNLSDQPVDIKLNRNNIAGNYTELFTEEKLMIKKELSVHLQPWGYKVYVQ